MLCYSTFGIQAAYRQQHVNDQQHMCSLFDVLGLVLLVNVERCKQCLQTLPSCFQQKWSVKPSIFFYTKLEKKILRNEILRQVKG